MDGSKGETQIIIFDTETTGFISSIDAPLTIQPKIIELFALKVDDETLDEIDSISLLIDPKETVSDEITKITTITTAMVKGQGDFPSHFKTIQNFWFGQRAMCGHNLTFDADMLEIELRRIGTVNKFPWPPIRLCTVELTEHYEGRRLKLIDLHTYLTGQPFQNAHRAESDVRATYTCLKELKKRGDLPKF